MVFGSTESLRSSDQTTVLGLVEPGDWKTTYDGFDNSQQLESGEFCGG